MASTETTLLKKVGDLLASQGLSSEQVAHELALLVIWAHTFDPERLKKSKEHPYLLADDYRELKGELGDAGVVFDQSTLYDSCTGAAIAEMVTLLASIKKKEPRLLVQALIDLFSKSRASISESLIPVGLSKLLTGLVKVPEGRVTLLYPAAISVAPMLPSPGSVVFRTNRYSALGVALSTLLDIKTELSSHLFEAEGIEQVDAVIAVPPFSVRLKSNIPLFGIDSLLSDEVAILKTIELTKSRGVILVPNGVLFRHASSSYIRQLLIKNNWLEAVVSLPAGTLSSTAIPVTVLVIDKKRAENDPVIFFDTTGIGNLAEQHDKISSMINTREVGKHGVLSDCNAIRDNDYDLTLNRYKLGPATAQLARMDNTVALDSVADIIRAQSIKPDGEEGDPLMAVFYEAAVKDITESGQLGMPDKQIAISAKLQRRAENQRLKAGDILLVIKGSVGRVAFVGDDCGHNWIAGQAFLIIRPKDRNVSTAYLYRYLSSELINTYLDEMATGTAMAILKANDVTEIPVPLPDSDTRAQIAEVHSAIMAEYQAIQEHRERLAHLEQQCWTIN